MTNSTARLDNFSAIVERYQDLVWAIAFAATGDAAASDDIAQETFFAAWKQQADIRELPRMRSYLASIARNLSYRSLRGHGRELLGDELAAAMPSDEPTPLDRVLADEQRSQVERALRKIPEASREPFVLFYLNGMSVSRVAADLNLSESAVKQRLYRARESLKASVADQLAHDLKRCRPALGATVLALITTQASEAAATTTALAEPSTRSSPPPASGAALLSKPALLSKAVALSLVATLGLVLYTQSKEADASATPASRQEAHSPVLDTQAATDSQPAPSPRLESDTSEVATQAELPSDQPLITGRLRIHFEGADADEDGRLSEEEVEDIRLFQEELLLALIEKHWNEEGLTVQCSTVGLDAGGVYEGGVSYNIDELRIEHARDTGEGVDLTIAQWIESQVAADWQEGRICYKTRAVFNDQVRQLKEEYPDGTIDWNLTGTADDGVSFWIPYPPEKLSQELALVADEEMARAFVDRWGVGLSDWQNDVYFDIRAAGFENPETMHRHPAIEELAAEYEERKRERLAAEENEPGLLTQPE